MKHLTLNIFLVQDSKSNLCKKSYKKNKSIHWLKVPNGLDFYNGGATNRRNMNCTVSDSLCPSLHVKGETTNKYIVHLYNCTWMGASNEADNISF